MASYDALLTMPEDENASLANDELMPSSIRTSKSPLQTELLLREITELSKSKKLQNNTTVRFQTSLYEKECNENALTEEIQKLVVKYDGLNQRCIEQRNRLDLAADFETQYEQLRHVEKEYFEDKCNKLNIELNDLNDTRVRCSKAEKKLGEAKKERDTLEKRYNGLMAESSKLRQYESRCERLEAATRDKNATINQLTDRASFADVQLENLTKNYNKSLYELKELNEDLKGKHAAGMCENNSLKAQLTTLETTYDKALSYTE